MNKILQTQLEIILNLQENFVKWVIELIWKQERNEYSIDVTNYWMVLLDDFYIPFDDFIITAKYEIPKDIFFEYQDSVSLNFESEDIKEYKKTLPEDFNWNLISFYRYKWTKTN